MRNGMIKAGVCVPSLRVGDPQYNAGAIIDLMKEQRDCGLLVFPELSLCGYTCADLFQQASLVHGVLDALGEVVHASADLKGMTVAVGLPVRVDNVLYNAAAFVSEGKLCGIVPKSYLPTYSEYYEDRWFTSGRDVLVSSVHLFGEDVPFGTHLLFDNGNGVVIGTDICEDLWIPDRPSTHACLAGANVIVNLSASDELIGKEEFRRDMVLQQSSSCYCAYLYASSGTQESSTDLVFSGALLMAANGRLLKEKLFAPENTVETALIDIDSIVYNRLHQSTFLNDGVNAYKHIPVAVSALGDKDELSVSEMLELLKKEEYTVAKNPFVPADDAERAKRCERILNIQANGLATRVKSTGLKTLVIGISGGLDSTLALLVCAKAREIVPDIRIMGYTMPVKGNTSSQTYENSLKLMRALDVEVHEVPIADTVAMHLKDIGHSLEYQGQGDTTYENAQARMRTYILMDVANMERGLVVGTGDLSELALGWCTYNGDHMSMYGVNASVPKTLVQYICRTYADSCGKQDLHDVLYAILDTPISPELTPAKNGQIAQKTEETIGKYDLNDFFLFYVLRYGYAPGKILCLAMLAYPSLSIEEGKSALKRFYKRFFQNQFKRSCLPDGPKVGSVTLSPRGDWRMPSDASAALWLRQVDEIV